MTYGLMDSLQREAVRDIVRGQRVIDLGCGDGGWSQMLARIGAEHVVALDKKLPDSRPTLEGKITWVERYFEDYNGEMPEIAFLSWPINRPIPELLALVERARTVIYLGKNTDGTSCGWPDLFEHFSSRRLVRHRPKRANTLAVYGELDIGRKLTGEEIAGRFYSDVGSKMLMFDEAERLADEADVVTRLAWRG